MKKLDSAAKEIHDMDAVAALSIVKGPLEHYLPTEVIEVIN